MRWGWEGKDEAVGTEGAWAAARAVARCGGGVEGRGSGRTHRRHIQREPDRVESGGGDGSVVVRVPNRLIVTVETALVRPATQVKR